jgi:hypothetical protein
MPGKTNPVVLVPGIMGSKLSINGHVVWAADTRGLRTIFTPSYLLPWLPADVGAPVAVYDPVIRFLQTDLGYQGDELFLFGYDWRVGIESAARSLRDFVDQSVRMEHGGRIIFLAHSLGCLVVRWAIINGLIAPKNVRLVIAAGPPFLGSASAFRSVIEMPQINDLFHRLFQLARLAFPGAARRLELLVTKTLMCVLSLVELMPPRDIPIIVEQGGTQLFSAFEWKGWPSEVAAITARALSVQDGLGTLPWPASVPRKLVMSDAYETETGYRVDANDPFTIMGQLPTALGDGTVLSDSALEFGSDQAVLRVASKHGHLLCDQQVFAYLRQTL